MDLSLFIDLEKLGESVRCCRLRNGLTVRQLADKAAVSEELLYLVEEGDREPSLSAFVRIVHALDVDPASLLS